MPVVLSQIADQDRFSSVHVLAYGLGRDRHCIEVSGIAQVDIRAPQGDGWHREDIRLDLDLGDCIDQLRGSPSGDGRARAFLADQWLATMSLNAVSTLGATAEAGWAVDDFCVVQQDAGGREVALHAAVAVLSRFGVLHRVCYHVSLLGRLVEPKSEEPSSSPATS
jgi:hypothetical protein